RPPPAAKPERADAVASEQAAMVPDGRNVGPAPAWTLEKPDGQTVDLIWDTVWWRRVVYFAAVAATMVLTVYPFLPDAQYALTGERAQGLQEAAPSSWLADILSGFLPGFAKPWLDAVRTNLFIVAALVIVIAILLKWGRILDRRIHDRALAAWNKDWRSSRLSGMKMRFGMAALFAAAALFSLVALINRDWSLCQIAACPKDVPAPLTIIAHVVALSLFGGAITICAAIFIATLVYGAWLWKQIR